MGNNYIFHAMTVHVHIEQQPLFKTITVFQLIFFAKGSCNFSGGLHKV